MGGMFIPGRRENDRKLPQTTASNQNARHGSCDTTHGVVLNASCRRFKFMKEYYYFVNARRSKTGLPKLVR